MRNTYDHYDPILHEEKHLHMSLIQNDSEHRRDDVGFSMSSATQERKSNVLEQEKRPHAPGRIHFPHTHGPATIKERTGQTQRLKHHILILCDDYMGRSVLREFLEKEGFDVSEMMFAECFSEKRHDDYCAVLVDMGTCQLQVPTLRDYLREYVPDIPIIVVDEPNRNENRAQSLNELAFSHVMRPCNRKDLLGRVESAVKFSTLARENRMLRQSLGMPTYCPELYGTSPLSESRRRQINAFAKLGGGILLCGEPGSGKLLTAQQIHLSGPRAEQAFQVVHCAGMTAITLDALLFGYARGTFNGGYGERAGLFELMDGGTIYFGQINALPPSIQTKLARYLKDGYYIRNGAEHSIRVDVQVIAGTSQNLSVACLTNSFSEELYYQLNAQCIKLAALKEMIEDIPTFARTLLSQFTFCTGGHSPMITNEALARLQQHSWPGNFNEFHDVVFRACLRAKNSQISEKDVVFDGPNVSKNRDAEHLGLAGMSIAEVERRLIIETLAANGGNRSISAKQLGVSEKTIYNKAKQYKLKDKF